MSDLEVGGLQRHAIDLARRLRARGYFVKLVVARDNVSPRLLEGMQPEDYVLLNDSRRMLDPRSWPRAWRTVAGFRPDVVVGVGPTPPSIMAFGRLAGRVRAKLACTFGTTIPKPRDPSTKPLFGWTMARTDALAYCSQVQAAFWKARGVASRNDVVIYNGVDTEAYRPPSAAERAAGRALVGLADGDYVVGHVGAFRVEKNHVQLVQAVHDLRAEGLPAKGLFVGGGVTRPEIEAKAAALGVTDHIVLAGEHSDVRPFIHAMDMGVLCSTGVETFSLSALEMLSSGVPMVHSLLGGAAEMMRDEVNGYLFPIGDTARLVQVLTEAAAPSVRARLSAAARADILARFAIETMVDQYDVLFRRLAA